MFQSKKYGLKVKNLPDVDFLGTRFVANDLWSHPRHSSNKRHPDALVCRLAARAKVRDLHDVIPCNQHAETPCNIFTFIYLFVCLFIMHKAA